MRPPLVIEIEIRIWYLGVRKPDQRAEKTEIFGSFGSEGANVVPDVAPDEEIEPR
jgi:hypothetical protein